VGTGEIAGTVAIVGTGQPARRARVNLSAAEGGGSRSTTTDELGRFAFAGLLAGRYSLNASKPGHVGGSYGQTRPGRPGTAIQLADGQKFEAKLEIARGGVITGTVLDEYGDAVPGTQVRVMRYAMQSGQRTLQQAGGGATDDRGIYRVFGLQPGEYVLAATPRNLDGPLAQAARVRAQLDTLRERLAGAQLDETETRTLTLRASMLQGQLPEEDEQSTGYAPVYYPGTTTPAQAASIVIDAGEERGGVDLQLQRVSVAQVEGIVINPTGTPVQNVQLTLVNAGQAVPGVGSVSTRADGDGKFRLANVAPGQYTLMARAAAGGPRGGRGAAQGRGAAAVIGRGQETTDRLWAALDLTVDGRNLSNVSLSLQQGLTISGRIAFDASAKQPPPDLTRLRVNAVPADAAGQARGLASPANGRVEASGRFTIAGVVPGRYRLTASGAGAGWSLESAVVDSQDTLDFPVEVKPGQAITSAVITFTDRQSALTGSLRDERGQPATGYTLILYPEDQRFWTAQSRRIRTARPATDGTFTFGNVPPGDYRIVPVLDAEPGSWYDPAYLQQIDFAAERVQIAEGEKKVQNLRVSAGAP
jgi:hypothetical protein